MGTDATALVEVYLQGRWVPALFPMWPNSEYDPEAEEPYLREELTLFPIMRRDYALFSVLADVRNRSGRGTQTMMPMKHPETGEILGEGMYDTDDGGHDPLIPIDNPRGIPDDASPVWREMAEAGEGILHDHTYLTLADLSTGEWDQKIFERAFILEEEYIEYRDKNVMPTMLAQGVLGDTTVVNEVEYAAGKRGEKSTTVDLRFANGTVEARAYWFVRHMKVMAMIAPDKDHTKVRIMVAFDS